MQGRIPAEAHAMCCGVRVLRRSVDWRGTARRGVQDKRGRHGSNSASEQMTYLKSQTALNFRGSTPAYQTSSAAISHNQFSWQTYMVCVDKQYGI